VIQWLIHNTQNKESHHTLENVLNKSENESDFFVVGGGGGELIH